jgi:hypothetical protein
MESHKSHVPVTTNQKGDIVMLGPWMAWQRPTDPLILLSVAPAEGLRSIYSIVPCQ